MNLTAKLLLTLKSGGGYVSKVLGYNPIAYWRLNEASGTAATCLVTSAQNGTYSASDIAGQDTGFDNGDAPLFVPGDTDDVDVQTSSLQSAFGSTEGSCAFWVKVRAGSVWTDGSQRGLVFLYADGSNKVQIFKSANNTVQFQYLAGGTNKFVNISDSSTAWHHLGMTWSVSNDRVRAYVDGVLTGTPATALGTYSGSIAFSRLGSNSGPLYWDGSMRDVALFDSEVTAAVMLDLATA